jgi:hypothetical protein
MRLSHMVIYYFGLVGLAIVRVIIPMATVRVIIPMATVCVIIPMLIFHGCENHQNYISLENH